VRRLVDGSATAAWLTVARGGSSTSAFLVVPAPQL
jgi:hypothetical protein